MPTLEAYYRAHAAEGFAVVAVDVGDPAAEVEHFVQAMDLTFPVWLDPQLAALAAFKYPGLPSSYVIDRAGTVRLAWTGAISQEMLDRHLTPLLES
jgi:peroxiredoxin